MVRNHKMIENEMGYRGSKSFLNKNKSVKEQRVDGSCFINNKKLMKLRCTLMGFEINYQTKIPSKQFVIQTKNFSTNSLKFCQNLVQVYTPSINSVSNNDVNNNKLNPWFVTGFADAEGCFGLYIYKNANYKTGWSAGLVFQISLHEKDKIILEQIQNYFGVGGLTSHGSTSLKYSVRSHKDLQTIIDHFDKFPLITNKLNDYKLFKLAYILFLKKEQLTLEGIKKLVSIKSSMNLGLSPELKTIFSNIEGFKKENISKYPLGIPDPN
jgi:LAGLIDADG endonuclease